MSDEAGREGGAGTGRVLLNTGALFVLSFLMSANGTVLPQLFFQRHHPEQKVLLLAVCLLSATLLAIGGVLASRRGGLHRGPALAALGATLAAEGALFLVTSAWAYVALNAAAQLGVNFLMNHLDQAALSRAGLRGRRLADAASNAVRLVGMLAAPAFFTAFHERVPVVLAVLAAGLLLAVVSAASALDRPSATRAARAVARFTGPLPRADRLFFAYVVALYVALTLFAANVIYLLRDVVRLASPERRGGTTIVVVFAAALVSGALDARLRGPHRGVRLWALAAPVPPLALSAAALLAGVEAGFAAVIAAAILIGAPYGVFLAELRDRSSRGGDPRLLTLYNNVANLSALAAFAIMTALVATAGRAPAHPRLLALIGGLPIVALPLLFASRPRPERSP